MKKRSLSLFLALLMVFGSVLPVFATETDPTSEQGEELDTNVQEGDPYYSLYVDGATFNWMAYHAEEGTTNLEDENGVALSVTGSAAYGDGYLQVVNGTLTASNVYPNVVPANQGDEVSYTTELIYAAVDAEKTLDYGDGPKFEEEYGIIFGQRSYNVFTTWSLQESIIFTDAAGLNLHDAWASAYLAAKEDSALQETFWTPISETDYYAMLDAGQSANVRVNSEEVPAVGDYSTTGYEANWAGFQYVLNTLGRTNYYYGYNTTSANTPGFGNSYVMKTDLKINCYGWIANVDFKSGNYGYGSTKGYWSHSDFGAVTSHTWTEKAVKGYNSDGTAERYKYQNTLYSDGVQAFTVGPANLRLEQLTPSSNFVVNGFDADYYAIRIYPGVLSEEEKAQNHFADLANYVEIDIDKVNAFLKLPETNKQAIYTKFATTTFADADKAAIEAAINEQVINVEYGAHIAKYEKLADLYVTENLIALWSAYGAKQVGGTTIGVINRGAELTYKSNGSYNAYDENGAVVPTEGTAAYGDGYLRLVNGTLTVGGVYLSGISTVTGYTTEMIYATYDANRQREYEGAKFDVLDTPIFAEKVEDVFTVWSMSEDLTFTDAKGKAMQEEWAKAYLIANNNAEYRATAWFPISEAHYNAALGVGMTVREVEVGGDGVADYSKTGYEANADAYGSVLSNYDETSWNRYYHGYYYVSQKDALMADVYDWLEEGYVKPGIGNSYVMKSEINRDGAWVANNYVLDFENWGPDLGNWSRYDFGVVTSHTWEERIDKNNSSGGYRYGIKTYGDSQTILDNDEWGGSGVGMNTDFIANGFDADYYAIRIYSNVDTDSNSFVEPLTVAQKAQNHFVDLISYHDIDIEFVEMFEDLANKTALYDAFASTMVKDTSKADLEGAIVAASLGVDSTDMAGTYVQFLGYQVKVNGDPGLRAVFNVNKNGEIANATLVEVGAIMAIAGDRTVADLTVAKNESGVYEAVGAQMMNAAVYKDEAWAEGNLYENGDMITFGYTCLFNDLVQDTEGEMAPAAKLQTELLFRGYVVIEVDGVQCVFYTDMTSDAFGDSVSMYELSTYADYQGYGTSQTVIGIVEG